MKSDELIGQDITVVYETDNFYIGMVEAVSPFLIVDEIPNYFIFNRQTAKIEGMSNSLKAAKGFLDYLESMDDEEGMSLVSDVSVPPAPISH